MLVIIIYINRNNGLARCKSLMYSVYTHTRQGSTSPSPATAPAPAHAALSDRMYNHIIVIIAQVAGEGSSEERNQVNNVFLQHWPFLFDLRRRWRPTLHTTFSDNFGHLLLYYLQISHLAISCDCAYDQ